MIHILASFSKILNFWPDTDYCHYLPIQKPSEQAWQNVGKNIGKSLIVTAFKEYENSSELEKFNRLFEQIEIGKYTDYLSNDIVNNEGDEKIHGCK